MSKLIFLFASFFFTSITYSASFDCARASTLIEQAICRDHELSALDERLMVAYIRALKTSASKSELKAEQLQWLKTNRRTCETNVCLRKAYLARLEELNGMSTNRSYLKPVSSPTIKSNTLPSITPKVKDNPKVIVTPLVSEPIRAQAFEPNEKHFVREAQISDSGSTQSWEDDLIKRIESLPAGE
jgi:uncharacterized protein